MGVIMAGLRVIQLGFLVVLVVVILSSMGIINFGFQSLTNPEVVDFTVDAVSYTEIQHKGQSNQEIISRNRNAVSVGVDCLVSLPGYREVLRGSVWVDGTTEFTYTDVDGASLVYANKPSGVFYYEMPKEHPVCVAEIEAFARSNGFVSPDDINETVYVCTDGSQTFSFDSCGVGGSVSPVFSSPRSGNIKIVLVVVLLGLLIYGIFKKRR
jgi:hypothetical protein